MRARVNECASVYSRGVLCTDIRNNYENDVDDGDDDDDDDDEYCVKLRKGKTVVYRCQVTRRICIYTHSLSKINNIKKNKKRKNKKLVLFLFFIIIN